MNLPVQYFLLLFRCHFKSCADGKETVSAVPCNLTPAKVQIRKDLKGRQGRQDIAKRLMNGKANCCGLLKRITKLKSLNSVVNLSPVTSSEVASNGPMAPCRSHHGYYIRQNWIFEEIHQELSPVTCKLDDEKQTNLRSTLRIMEVLPNDLCDQNQRQIE